MELCLICTQQVVFFFADGSDYNYGYYSCNGITTNINMSDYYTRIGNLCCTNYKTNIESNKYTLTTENILYILI